MCRSGKMQKIDCPFQNNHLRIVNVTFDPRQGPAEELPFGPGEVDLVTAMTAAHWFERQKFLVEADRVLRPGGCLALLSYSMDIELEYGEVSNELNHICKEVHRRVKPAQTF